MYAGYIIHDLDAYFEIVELAKQNGKKPGESMQEEFEIILKKRPEAFQLLGVSDKDVDMMTGDLREKGMKILNISEVDRIADNKRKTNG